MNKQKQKAVRESDGISSDFLKAREELFAKDLAARAAEYKEYSQQRARKNT